MKTYIVHLSDAGRVDRQTVVVVGDETPLGNVTQSAVDDFMAANDGGVEFPIFVDIHLAEEHRAVSWMHPPPAPSAPPTPPS